MPPGVLGHFTQTDPIGIAGGLNTYGYAGGDPINFSDPFGLKVCFGGSASEIRELSSATEEATGTSISLDDQNCVSEYEVVEGGDDFEEVQGIFGDLVADDRVAFIEFGDPERQLYSGTSGVSMGSRSRILRGDVGGFFFRGRDPQGRCRNGQRYGSLGAVVGHELIGEVPGVWAGERKRGSHTVGAIRRSNAVQRALGQSQRGC